MRPSAVLNDDLVYAAISAGARRFDATAALAAAEPGAFLHGDLHMTPKGHHALAEAIAKSLASPAIRAACSWRAGRPHSDAHSG
jgi:hypothetical protein